MIARQRYEGITTAAALGANCPITKDAAIAAPPAVVPQARNGKRRW
jgi:hypothetical protein